MTYSAIRHVHIICVVLSFCGFFLRGLLMLAGSPALNWRITRVLPHVVDTLLLGSAITLAVWSGQYPLAQPWLTAKVAGLMAYIVLGGIALRRGRRKSVRLGAWLAALGVFGYIVSVAVTRNPMAIFGA